MRITLAQHGIALALVCLDIAARAARIRALLPVSLWRAVVVNTCGDALAAVTPARVGGEPIRFLAFQSPQASRAAVLAAFATEVGVDAALIVAGTAILALAVPDVGRAWVDRVVALATSRGVRWLMVALVAALGLGSFAVVRLRRRWSEALVHGVREVWRILATRSPVAVAQAVGWTTLSMIARTALLPVLAARLPGVTATSLIAPSFVLLFSQTILPAPSGIGPVEFGFAAWFAGTLGGADIARLLLLWRFYTVGLGALAGVALLLRFKAVISLAKRGWGGDVSAPRADSSIGRATDS